MKANICEASASFCATVSCSEELPITGGPIHTEQYGTASNLDILDYDILSERKTVTNTVHHLGDGSISTLSCHPPAVFEVELS